MRHPFRHNADATAAISGCDGLEKTEFKNVDLRLWDNGDGSTALERTSPSLRLPFQDEVDPFD